MGLLDLVLPDRCPGCGGEDAPLCPGCRAALVRLREPLCARCGAPVAWPVERCRECAGRRLAFARSRSAVAYEGAARRLVSAWKQGGRRSLARIAADLVRETVARPEADALTFVPAVGARQLWRGHNPAERLACELSSVWGLPVLALLCRAAAPRPQRGLPLAERRRNVAGSFRSARPSPPRVVLVDDVYTSGATVAAASAVLRRGGARRVEVVTFARALRDSGSVRER